MSKTKEKLPPLVIKIIYESKKLLTCYSLQQYLLYEYYEAKRIEKTKREEFKRKRRKVQNTIYYLKNSGFLDFKKGESLKLSRKGLLKHIINQSKLYKPNKSKTDYFYLIIFDVPEELKQIRNLFRKVLYNFGAVMLQKSVFILKDEKVYQHIKELIKVSDIESYVKLITALKIN